MYLGKHAGIVRNRWMAASVAAAAALVVTVAGGTALAAVTSQAATVCRNVAVPVTVAGQAGSIAGTLCAPPHAKTLQLLVSGWTYNRGYFDVAVDPQTYSYARAANGAGYATLAIDRLGAGASLHPLSLFSTVEADIRTVHEVVQAARKGAFGVPYDRVVSVGHSLGSIVAQGEAGIYGDVDALITTGFSSAINYANAYVEIAGRDHPAVSDPKFADSGLDPLFWTSQPGTRKLFTNTENTDPRLHAYDESALKDTDNLIEGVTLASYSATNAIAKVRVPVLVVTGTKDPFFCGLNSADCTSSATLLQHEKEFYSGAVEAYAVPNTGHDIELERTAPLAHQRMLRFADATVGAGAGEKGTQPGVRPAPVPPPSGSPSVQNQLLDVAFAQAVKPVADAYAQLKQPVPGLGDTTNPNPASAVLLAKIGALVSQFAPNAAQAGLGF
jgi:pimeloyl-ACP methyl ester carboxylesterase